MAEKNLCGKARTKDNPYEKWVDERSGFEYLVLKKYQAPSKEAANPNARWFLATKSPYTYGSYELGDGYAHDVIRSARLVEVDGKPFTGEQPKANPEPTIMTQMFG
jgi:hypothetical protein